MSLLVQYTRIDFAMLNLRVQVDGHFLAAVKVAARPFGNLTFELTGILRDAAVGRE